MMGTPFMITGCYSSLVARIPYSGDCLEYHFLFIPLCTIPTQVSPPNNTMITIVEIIVANLYHFPGLSIHIFEKKLHYGVS